MIHASLMCLYIDPTLWDKVLQRDEFILFHKRDLENPTTSSFLELLRNHDSPHIRSMCTTLERLLRMSPEEIPPLEEIAISTIGDATIEEHFKTLGLDTVASSKQIQEAYMVWQRVWSPQHYSQSKGLAKRAAQRLEAIREAHEAITKYANAPSSP